jgi:hypothetical protein
MYSSNFNPLSKHSQERWQGIYGALMHGSSLPPVTLIEIGGRYFVRDGHHRISVARALGRLDIEAEVTAWDVNGPLPWEMAAPVHQQGWVKSTAAA